MAQQTPVKNEYFWNLVNENKLELVQTILARPESSNMYNINWSNPKEMGATPIFAAIKNKNPSMVSLLIQNGADVKKVIIGLVGYTPLYIASDRGNLEIVNSLIKAGVNVNQATDEGVTPLCIAAKLDRLEIVKSLITAGANVNQATNEGITPLFIASQNNSLEVVKELLNAGANPGGFRTSSTDPETPYSITTNPEIKTLIMKKIAELKKEKGLIAGKRNKKTKARKTRKPAKKSRKSYKRR
jgi:ankyrin repeat protein